MSALLLIETSSRLCSVAVAIDGVIACEREELDPKGYRHAEALSPMIQSALSEAGVRVRELSGIAAAHGPGSYTGLRIGLAAAKGLALPWGIPCYGIDSLELLAAAVREASSSELPIWVAMDARRSEVYSAWFNAQGERMSPDIPEVIDALWIDRPAARSGGDGVEKVMEHWLQLEDSGVRYARARHGLEAALRATTAEHLATWEPRYLKVFGQVL
jgi:tRNA threonylcarbamoyl adenosine modification protein YeaZ